MNRRNIKSKPRGRAKAPTAKQLAARRRFSRIMKNGGFKKRAKKAGRRNPKRTVQPRGSTWTPAYRAKVKRAAASVRREMRAEGKLGARSTRRKSSRTAPARRTGGVFSRLFSRFANPSALQQHQALMKEWLKYEKAWRAGRLDAKGRVKQMQIERRLRQLEATIARQNPGKKINVPGFGPKFKRAVVVIVKKARRVVVKNASRRKAVTRKRRNPKRPYNMFRGRPAESFYNVKTSDRTPSAGLKEAGKLHAVKLSGGRATYKFRGKAKLMYKGNNLYFGGWKFKRPNPPAEVDLGPVTMIEYLADKPHIEGDNLKRIYFHKMGEDGGYPPHLVVDAEGYPFLDGGSYGITPEGIVH